uniref:MRG-binding protein n=1 Tax=Rhipicephalus appendiculatus TaxID=34631 RepID=A0A131Z4I4_RHIAP
MDSIYEKPAETLDWNVDTEVQLFHAMKGHKPVGVNRYFQMACIHEKFSASLNKDISSQTIWDHLDTMYDMAALGMQGSLDLVGGFDLLSGDGEEEPFRGSAHLLVSHTHCGLLGHYSTPLAPSAHYYVK